MRKTAFELLLYIYNCANFGFNCPVCMDIFVNWMRVCCIIVYTLHKQILGLGAGKNGFVKCKKIHPSIEIFLYKYTKRK